MSILHDGTCTMNCTVLEDIRIARAAGYDGMEVSALKLDAFQAAGFSLDVVRRHLDGYPVKALTFIGDVDRSSEEDHDALIRECELRFSQAVALGAEYVELTNGPIGPGIGVFDGYEGPAGSRQEVIETTVRNLRVISDMAADRGLKLYLETLGWAKLRTLDDALLLVNEAGRPNLGLVVDFWHFWINGATAADLSKVRRDQIFGVHVCDSLMPPADGKPITHELREVWTGGGHIPLQEWIDGIVATGYEGWWSAELFSTQSQYHDPLVVASALRTNLQLMLDMALPPEKRPWPKTPRPKGGPAARADAAR